MEALIAAIYLDQGYRVAKEFVFNTLIKKHLDFEDVVKTEIDFKSRLIDWGQKHKLEVRFDVIDSYYASKHIPIFHSSVLIADVETAEGVGYSKKESHQRAAEKALKILEEDLHFKKSLLDMSDDAMDDNKEDVDAKRPVI